MKRITLLTSDDLERLAETYTREGDMGKLIDIRQIQETRYINPVKPKDGSYYNIMVVEYPLIGTNRLEHSFCFGDIIRKKRYHAFNDAFEIIKDELFPAVNFKVIEESGKNNLK
jgi:hypothetical protein